MRLGLHQVSTFAADPFRGNPAYVLVADRDLPDALLQRIAGQLREPVLASLRAEQTGRALLRFHTSEQPHAGAGHAMAAAAHVLLDAAGGAHGEATLRLTDGSERLVRRDGLRVSVPWPVMPFAPVDLMGTLETALGSAVAETLDSAFGYVAVLRRSGDVAALTPDIAALAALDRSALIVTAPGDRSDFVLRVFAPRLGLPEDPVCGTAHRIIVPYWAERLGRQSLFSRQISPRGGELWCELAGNDVRISGECVTFLTGSVELPD